MNLTPISRLIFHRLGQDTERWSGDASRRQIKTLEWLLKKAAKTEIGEKYGFSGILSAGPDIYKRFSEKVPLTDYEAIRHLVMRMVKGERDILWPGVCRNFAQSSGTSGGKSKYIPITEDSLKRNHYRGAALCMARYLHLRPDSRIFSGKGFVLGGSFANELRDLPEGVRVGDLSATLINRITPLAEYFRVPDKATALLREWEEKLPMLATKAAEADVTNLSGVPSWMLVVLKEVLEKSHAADLTEVWPHLEVFFHGGISFNPYREEYRKLIPTEQMKYFETYNASEGFFAIQRDFGSPEMLLIPDAGVFYEFLPWGTTERKPVPWWDAEAGKTYELLLTASNGLWRYHLGDTVRIHSLSPLTITIAGRTKTYINAFGEELMEYNAEKAMAEICRSTGCSVRNYTAGPLYAHDGKRGRHQWLIEWEKAPDDINDFSILLDNALRSLNSDYDAKRHGGIFLDPLTITSVPKGSFNKWLKTKGNGVLGGQKKIPRLSNDRKIIEEVLRIIEP